MIRVVDLRGVSLDPRSVVPRATVVVEDAISGVQAGHAGGFSLVIGVDREGSAKALLENGADVVVTDLGEILPR